MQAVAVAEESASRKLRLATCVPRVGSPRARGQGRPCSPTTACESPCEPLRTPCLHHDRSSTPTAARPPVSRPAADRAHRGLRLVGSAAGMVTGMLER